MARRACFVLVFFIVGQSEWKNLLSHINTPQFSPGKHVHSEVSFQAAAKPCVCANFCCEEKNNKRGQQIVFIASQP